MSKTTVKLSYSILNAWAHGQWEQAVGQYVGQPLPATPEMELGRVKHEQWERQIKATGALPDELGEWPLTAPVTEQKYQKRIPVNDELDILLRGVPDCLDGPRVYEWKSGLTSASSYVDSMQTDYYKLLIPQISEAVYVVWNPYTEGREVGVKFLGRTNAEAALEHVLTFGLEMIDYLKAQRLLKNYGAAR
jgi:hypothetical protein